MMISFVLCDGVEHVKIFRQSAKAEGAEKVSKIGGVKGRNPQRRLTRLLKGYSFIRQGDVIGLVNQKLLQELQFSTSQWE